MLVLRIWSDVSLTNTYTLFFYKKPRDPLSPFETSNVYGFINFCNLNTNPNLKPVYGFYTISVRSTSTSFYTFYVYEMAAKKPLVETLVGL